MTANEDVDEELKDLTEWLLQAAEEGGTNMYQCTRDLTGIEAELRKYVQEAKVESDAKEARVFKVNVPSIIDLSSKTKPSEPWQTIMTVSIPVTKRGAYLLVRYYEIKRSGVDIVRVVKGIEQSFVRAATFDIEKIILNALDTNMNVHYAGGKTAEADITASDVLKLNELITARRKLIEQSKRYPLPGELVLVCHPKQYYDLLSDAGLLKAVEFRGPESVRKGIIPQILGVNVVITYQVSTGTGSTGVTTCSAHLFYTGAVGLAISRDLKISASKDPRGVILLNASYVAGAKLIEPTWAVKVVTA